MLRRLAHQIGLWQLQDKPASRLAKLVLGLRFDCYVSSRSEVYYADRIQLARDVVISEGAMLNYRSGRGGSEPNLIIGSGTKIMPGARLIPQQGFIRIGRNCSIQYGCMLYGVGGLEIGDDTRVAADTVITPMNHTFADLTTPIWQQPETAVGIRIGSDVWIGNGVRILDGVEIGNGCVIGAGSVVTKSIPPFSIAVGVPARVVRRRDAQTNANDGCPPASDRDMGKE